MRLVRTVFSEKGSHLLEGLSLQVNKDTVCGLHDTKDPFPSRPKPQANLEISTRDAVQPHVIQGRPGGALHQVDDFIVKSHRSLHLLRRTIGSQILIKHVILLLRLDWMHADGHRS